MYIKCDLPVAMKHKSRKIVTTVRMVGFTNKHNWEPSISLGFLGNKCT